MEFLAMDFETANRQAHSACSLGMVHIKDGRIVDERYSLIRPETSFHPGNIRVHHIRPIDVIHAPKFNQL